MRAPLGWWMTIALRRPGLGGALALPALAGLACEPATLPQDKPGPPGCGLRDPRNTSPNMLSMAQRMAFHEMRAVDDVRKNEHGGLDWIYKMSSGSVFGEQQTVEVLSFNAAGILVSRKTDLLRKVGK